MLFPSFYNNLIMLCLERLCFVHVFILPFNPDTFCSATHHPLTTSSSDSYYLSMSLMDLRLSPAPGRLRDDSPGYRRKRSVRGVHPLGCRRPVSHNR